MPAHFENGEKCDGSKILASVHTNQHNVKTMKNLPFSKSAGKNVPFSCEREAYPSHFSSFSKCAGIV